MNQKCRGIVKQKNGVYFALLASIFIQLQLCSSWTARRPFKHVLCQSTSHLHARWKRGEIHSEDDMEREKRNERPTLTETAPLGPTTTPAKPKIVVLGASGKIGRLVVQQLMEMQNLEITVVAFVRDYDKACHVFYDEVLVPRTRTSRGPKLQIVVGNLVLPEELPSYVDEDESLWETRAESASQFYKTKVLDYDNRELLPDINEALEEALKGCTTIISCVGAIRPTNLWSDYIQLPIWRVIRKDVSSWCDDERHPYYVHYISTRKVLRLAEIEQRRREAAIIEGEEKNKKKQVQEKIRFIRISDLCLSKQPWSLVPLVTNIIQSMVFRYQDMTERLIDESTVVDTIILRPGDLTDEERDYNTTFLQVDPSGTLPYPAIVSREDVASLAVCSALFGASVLTNTTEAHKVAPFHMTLALRWVGECAEYHPSQGVKTDGAKDAEECLEQILKGNRKSIKRSRRRQFKTMQAYHPTLVRFMKMRRRSLKPYAIFAAVPVYLMLTLISMTLLQQLPFHQIPGYYRALSFIVRLQQGILAAIMTKLTNALNWFITKMSQQKSYFSF